MTGVNNGLFAINANICNINKYKYLYIYPCVCKLKISNMLPRLFAMQQQEDWTWNKKISNYFIRSNM